MYKRRTYRARHYQPARRKRFSLPRSKQVVIAGTVVLFGFGTLGVVQAGGNHWNRYLGDRVPIIHKKAQEKPANKGNGGNDMGGTVSNSGANAGQQQPATPVPGNGATSVPATPDLSQPDKKEIAMRLVSSAENSSLDWRAQFQYIEDIGDGRGYTAGIIGFCSGTGDMLELVERYTKQVSNNPLAAFLPALRAVNGTDSHAGLGTAFEKAWKTAATDPRFQQAQEAERDRVYFNPAVALAKQDGLGTLGQFIYYDAAVMHGPDAWGGGLPDLRNRAIARAKMPAQGGDPKAYLLAFLDVRKEEMGKDPEHRDLSRINDAQLVFLNAGNFDLHLPLSWKVYGDPFTVTSL